MELIYTDASHTPLGVLRNFELDMAIGDDENDFELTLPIIRNEQRLVSVNLFRGAEMVGARLMQNGHSYKDDAEALASSISKPIPVSAGMVLTKNTPADAYNRWAFYSAIVGPGNVDVDTSVGFSNENVITVPANVHYVRICYQTASEQSVRVTRQVVEQASDAQLLTAGAYVYEHGTDRGGVVDAVEYDGTGKVPLFKYSGRTWHGILENSVTRPDAGASHLVLSGDLNACISTLISRAGLGAVFAASEVPCGVSATNYQIPRYINLYEALTRLCRDHGMRLEIAKGGGLVSIGAVRRTEWLNGYLSDFDAAMKLSSTERTCNHLVLLGEGELEQRLVRDVYADSQGNVSTTQTLFGVDEVAEVYEQSNESDPAKLLESGIKKLSEMQFDSDVSMSLPDGAGYALGDIVEGIAVDAGFKATAEVIKQVISVDDDGFCSVSYEAGLPSLSPLR